MSAVLDLPARCTAPRPRAPAGVPTSASANLVLHPGDVACVNSGTRLATLLGSCVSIALADTARSVGALCHFVHASASAGGASAMRPTARATDALAAMSAALRARGIDPLRCDAWVYGGGNMFPGLAPDEAHVGEANARWALRELDRLGIRIVTADVGGRVYRKLQWTVGVADPIVQSVSV